MTIGKVIGAMLLVGAAIVGLWIGQEFGYFHLPAYWKPVGAGAEAILGVAGIRAWNKYRQERAVEEAEFKGTHFQNM